VKTTVGGLPCVLDYGCGNMAVAEYGIVSRQLLRLADRYGNWAYGVNVPTRYFDLPTWRKLVDDAGMVQLKVVSPVRIHEGLFGVIIPRKDHFVCMLSAE
jgi:hypothetical protein